jgi:hypothetical protein
VGSNYLHCFPVICRRRFAMSSVLASKIEGKVNRSFFATAGPYTQSWDSIERV